MSDDKYTIPKPPVPEKTQPAYHPREQRRANAAICVSVAAAAFTGWYAWDTHQIRLEAQRTAARQGEDIRKARDSSERSAKAAEQSASAAQALALAAQATLQNSVRSFQEEQRPQLEVKRKLMQRPMLYVFLHNRGKTAAYEVQSKCAVYQLTAFGLKRAYQTKWVPVGQISPDDDRAVLTFVSEWQIPPPTGQLDTMEVACDITYKDKYKQSYPLQYCFALWASVPMQSDPNAQPLMPDCNVRSYVSK